MLVATILATAVSTQITAADFAKIKKPSEGVPQSIGEYADGCISGAQKIDFDNPYYQVIRPQNNRFYGHPKLIQFIQDLGKNAHDNGLPILLIGDMSMPMGGRFIKGHASHQTGLDVDVWLRMVKKPLTAKELKSPWALNVVSDNWLSVNKYYNQNIYNLVKLAATDDRVDRIFLNPAIKAQLCADTPKNEQSWLYKVRPWWGHNAHMHVRLTCPEGSTTCIPPKAKVLSPSDSGCGEEVETWLEDIRHPKPKPAKPNKPKEPKPIRIECQQLLKGMVN